MPCKCIQGKLWSVLVPKGCGLLPHLHAVVVGVKLLCELEAEVGEGKQMRGRGEEELLHRLFSLLCSYCRCCSCCRLLLLLMLLLPIAAVTDCCWCCWVLSHPETLYSDKTLSALKFISCTWLSSGNMNDDLSRSLTGEDTYFSHIITNFLFRYFCLQPKLVSCLYILTAIVMCPLWMCYKYILCILCFSMTFFGVASLTHQIGLTNISPASTQL